MPDGYSPGPFKFMEPREGGIQVVGIVSARSFGSVGLAAWKC